LTDLSFNVAWFILQYKFQLCLCPVPDPNGSVGRVAVVTHRGLSFCCDDTVVGKEVLGKIGYLAQKYMCTR